MLMSCVRMWSFRRDMQGSALWRRWRRRSMNQNSWTKRLRIRLSKMAVSFWKGRILTSTPSTSSTTQKVVSTTVDKTLLWVIFARYHSYSKRLIWSRPSFHRREKTWPCSKACLLPAWNDLSSPRLSWTRKMHPKFWSPKNRVRSRSWTTWSRNTSKKMESSWVLTMFHHTSIRTCPLKPLKHCVNHVLASRKTPCSKPCQITWMTLLFSTLVRAPLTIPRRQGRHHVLT